MLSNKYNNNYIDKFKHFNSVPEFEVINGIDVYHPRFFSIPGHVKSIEVLTTIYGVEWRKI